MPWHATTQLADPPMRPALLPVRVDGRAIVLTAIAGSWYAVEDRCSHAGCAFSEDAAVEGDRLVCDCHGSEFDIRTGAVAGPPASEPIATFPVRENGGFLEVEL
jgi:3-phenylpropionate/trans-cinnamate dioxygenase ferredoxin subunit